MSAGKRHNKLALVKSHRKNQYLHAIEKLIDGEASPEYVTKRWQKLKVLPK